MLLQVQLCCGQGAAWALSNPWLGTAAWSEVKRETVLLEMLANLLQTTWNANPHLGSYLGKYC